MKDFNKESAQFHLELELDAQYRAMREEAGLVERPEIAAIAVSGPDAAEFLQGQLTNDVEALEPGGGCYANFGVYGGALQSGVQTGATGAATLFGPPSDLYGHGTFMLVGLGDLWKRIQRGAGMAFDQLFDNPIYFAVAAGVVILLGIWLLKAK